MDEFTTLNEDDTFEWSFTQPSFLIERDLSYKPLMGDPYSSEHWTEQESFPPPYLTTPDPASVGDLEQPGSNSYMRVFQGATLPERSRMTATRSQPWPDYFVESPELSFSSSSGSLEGSLASLSSSNAASQDWTPGDSSCSSSRSPSSQTNASSPDASQLGTSRPQQDCSKKRLRERILQASSPDALQLAMSEPGQGRAKRRLCKATLQASAGESPDGQFSRSLLGMSSLGALTPTGDQQSTRVGSLHDHAPPSRGPSGRSRITTLEHSCYMVAEAIQAVKSAPDEYLSLLGELGQVRRGLHSLQRNYSDDFGSRNSDQATAVLENLASQLQILAARVANVLSSGRLPPPRYNRLDPERRLGQRLWQMNTRRLVRSLCATISNLQVLQVESSPATTNSRVLTSRHNHQLVVSQAERHSRGVLLTAALSRLDSAVFPARDVSGMDNLPDVSGLAAGGLSLLEVDRPDRSRQGSRTGQLETTNTALPLMILAGLIAASLTNLSAVVSLGIMFLAATGVLWPGNGLFARATDTHCDQPPTPSIFSGTLSSTSSLLTAVASWLPLSTGSPGDALPVCFIPNLSSLSLRTNFTHLVVEARLAKPLSKTQCLSLVWNAEEGEHRVEHAVTGVSPLSLPPPPFYVVTIRRNYVYEHGASLT